MVHKGDVKIVAQMLRNLEQAGQAVAFNAPLVVAAPTYNIIDELGPKATGRSYRNIQVLNLTIQPRNRPAVQIMKISYICSAGLNLCMGNQEKVAMGDTVLATSTRLFKGRVVEDSDDVEDLAAQPRLWCCLLWPYTND